MPVSQLNHESSLLDEVESWFINTFLLSGAKSTKTQSILSSEQQSDVNSSSNQGGTPPPMWFGELGNAYDDLLLLENFDVFEAHDDAESLSGDESRDASGHRQNAFYDYEGEEDEEAQNDFLNSESLLTEFDQANSIFQGILIFILNRMFW
ncbi:unnamed protein product [Protopolystoma xenopodis]|uniref:Uncharacterized protein n=1 Tax=Protopolystoma xenopodis TaxID=117903 RepID=A0A3S5A7Q0_9PLAT|nr:unnamed protein product [Protopolystoma xenopodis]